VYVGSAPGQHTNLLVDMFDEVKRWVLIDPSKIQVKHPKVERINKFVTDEVIVGLKHRIGGGVIYINDMRTEPSEEAVAREMLDQARWGVHMRAKAMLLKIRMPFIETDGTHLQLIRSMGDVAITKDDRAVLVEYKKKNAVKCLESGERLGRKSAVLYLEGDVQPQVFAPASSTESRLIVFPTASGKYKLGKWDIRSYDWCMNDYNIGLRMRQDGYNMVKDLAVPRIRGVDDGYQCVRLISAFRRVYGAKHEYRMKQALAFLEKEMGRRFEDCPLITVAKRSQDDKYKEISVYWEKIWRNRVKDYMLFLHEQ
jgi:hypothetical protein